MQGSGLSGGQGIPGTALTHTIYMLDLARSNMSPMGLHVQLAGSARVRCNDLPKYTRNLSG